MNKLSVLLIAITFSFAVLAASDPQGLWVKSYAGPSPSIFSSLAPTPAGGTILAGSVAAGSTGPTLEDGTLYDACVIKLDRSGEIEWQKSYGGTDNDLVYSIIPVWEGGYLAAGETSSFGAAAGDAMILRINEEGGLLWAKRIGGSGEEWAIDAKQAENGGFVVLGTSKTTTAHADEGGTYDIWLFGLDGNGELLWQKTYDRGADDFGCSLVKTREGDLVSAGATTTVNGDRNALLIKTDPGGVLKWQKSFGGATDDLLYSIIEAPDGGFLVVGETYLNESSGQIGYSDAWVLRINSFGGDEWQKAYGLAMNDFAMAAAPSGKHGFIVAGGSKTSSGAYDGWVFKIDWSGRITWKRDYSLSSDEVIYSTARADDGRFFILGAAGIGDTGFPFLASVDKKGLAGPSCSAISESAIAKQKLSSGSGTPVLGWAAGTATSTPIKKSITPGTTYAASETICQN